MIDTSLVYKRGLLIVGLMIQSLLISTVHPATWGILIVSMVCAGLVTWLGRKSLEIAPSERFTAAGVTLISSFVGWAISTTLPGLGF
jgi:hypothetical protein